MGAYCKMNPQSELVNDMDTISCVANQANLSWVEGEQPEIIRQNQGVFSPLKKAWDPVLPKLVNKDRLCCVFWRPLSCKLVFWRQSLDAKYVWPIVFQVHDESSTFISIIFNENSNL